MLSADTHLYCFSKVLLAPYHNRIPAIGIVPKTRWRSPVWLPIFWCSNVTETRRPEGYGLRFEYRASFAFASPTVPEKWEVICASFIERWPHVDPRPAYRIIGEWSEWEKWLTEEESK